MFKSKTSLQKHKKKNTMPTTSLFSSQFQLHHQSSKPIHDKSYHSSQSTQIHDNSYRTSSSTHVYENSYQTHIRPPSLSTIRQKSIPSSAPHTQSVQSQPTAHESVLQHSSSSSSQLSSSSSLCLSSSSSHLLDKDQDRNDENEKKLLIEAEIIDAYVNILRTEKLTAKDVFRLKEGEKILVHVNELGQPIKAVGGLCTRFMTLLLKEPNLCPPDAINWRECKTRCGIQLLVELRRRFNLPQSEIVGKVIFSTFDEKFRTVKYRLKRKLFQLASSKLNEIDNIGEDIAQERHYTDDDLLQALDLVDAPENFVNHQWEMYKNHLKSSLSKKMSQWGKKAKADQVHTHTTGAISYVRKKDEFKLIYNREANNVEFFGISHRTKEGSYVGETTREFMDRATQEISKKTLEADISEPIDPERQSEIERDVMQELMGPDNPGRARGYGVGVTKSQVTKFSIDLRRMRGGVLTNEKRFLLDKVDSQSKKIESQSKKIESQSKLIEFQSKQIESQSKQIESQSVQLESQSKQMKTMEQKMDEFSKQLLLFQTAFTKLYGADLSSDIFFSTPTEGMSNTQQLSADVPREDFPINAIQKMQEGHPLQACFLNQRELTKSWRMKSCGKWFKNWLHQNKEISL